MSEMLFSGLMFSQPGDKLTPQKMLYDYLSSFATQENSRKRTPISRNLHKTRSHGMHFIGL